MGYLTERQEQTLKRRMRVKRLLQKHNQSQIARKLNESRQLIGQDVKWLKDQGLIE